MPPTMTTLDGVPALGLSRACLEAGPGHALRQDARELRGGAPAGKPAAATAHVRPGGGVQSSEERHAGRFLLALGETGTGGGDAGRRVHLVCAHCGSGIGVRCDHLDVAALFAQGLDLAC